MPSFVLRAISFLGLGLLTVLNGELSAAERVLSAAEWIWSPKYRAAQAPGTPVYFRKVVELGEVASAKLEITCDNSYEVFVNGERLAADGDWYALETYDLTKLLKAGSNTIAIKGDNESTGWAGLVASIAAVDRSNKPVIVVTDPTWKTSTEPAIGWQLAGFDDSQWQPAISFGKYGRTKPWGPTPSGASIPPGERFKPQNGFAVEEVIGREVGSLVAMTFNERGDILASREGGPLVLVAKPAGGGAAREVQIVSDKVKNCQGILAHLGRIYAVGDGPSGTAFYRLSDPDGNGEYETLETLLKFRGGMGEHGPHQPVVGPDGLIYLMIGNHAGVEGNFAATSPHRHYYEGDLLLPRYEDANGHAAGIKAPGGIVVRMDVDGKGVELFCGGFRNAYDIAFNADGELFTYDSDMEWDENLPWYRPTRVNHLVPGGEYGWRSGWMPWPDYYLDSLGSVVDTGRGSPTGIEFYNHGDFGAHYRDALFMCDWSRGRILAVVLNSHAGTYEGDAEVFLEGNPLNATDIAVGPDGGLYFSVGGRGTQGGIYRIVKHGLVDNSWMDATGVGRAMLQPQPESAWARAQIAAVKKHLGDRWGPQLRAMIEDTRNPIAYRRPFLELLQSNGPAPPADWLVGLSKDREVEVRRRVVYLMGLHHDATTGPRLVELLTDNDAVVRRRACESIVRSGYKPPADKLIPLLADHRTVAWAARKALEELPADDWREAVLKAEKPDVFLRGATGLLLVSPDAGTATAIVAGCRELLHSSLAEQEFVDTLRVIELAVVRGKLIGDQVAEVRQQLSLWFPVRDWRGNRELVRLLVALDDPQFAPRLVKEIENEQLPLVERIHMAMHARFLEAGWTLGLRVRLIEFYAHAQTFPGGNSFKGYLANASNDFAKTIAEDEQLGLLIGWRDATEVALQVAKNLPPSLSDPTVLLRLDKELEAADTTASRQLGREVLLALGRGGDPKSLHYLHEVFQSSPERRHDVAQAIGQVVLAQKELRPEDQKLLLESLSVVEGQAARDVLRALAKFPAGDLSPQVYRRVILLGLKLRDKGGQEAAQLLRKWTGKAHPTVTSPEALAGWQDWFRETYPDQPEAVLPTAEGNKWTFEQIASLLSGGKASGSVERGAVVFEKAQCVKCHRYGNRGEGIGPDLSQVSRRFQRKEIAESVVYPSLIISDQFAAKTVMTADGLTYTGLVGPTSDGIVVLQTDGEKVTIPHGNVDQVVPSKKSAMPDGLFNELSAQEIIDLFAYLSLPPEGA